MDEIQRFFLSCPYRKNLQDWFSGRRNQRVFPSSDGAHSLSLMWTGKWPSVKSWHRTKKLLWTQKPDELHEHSSPKKLHLLCILCIIIDWLSSHCDIEQVTAIKEFIRKKSQGYSETLTSVTYNIQQDSLEINKQEVRRISAHVHIFLQVLSLLFKQILSNLLNCLTIIWDTGAGTCSLIWLKKHVIDMCMSNKTLINILIYLKAVKQTSGQILHWLFTFFWRKSHKNRLTCRYQNKVASLQRQPHAWSCRWDILCP